MKKLYRTLAPIIFMIIVTNSFTRNMEFFITKFLIAIIFGGVIYNILSLLRKKNLFIYVNLLFIIFLLVLSYIKSHLYLDFLSGSIVLLIWSLTKKYLNNFQLYK